MKRVSLDVRAVQQTEAKSDKAQVAAIVLIAMSEALGSCLTETCHMVSAYRKLVRIYLKEAKYGPVFASSMSEFVLGLGSRRVSRLRFMSTDNMAHKLRH